MIKYLSICFRAYAHIVSKKVKGKKYGGVIYMAAKGPRENITLECTECKRRNYMTSKNKRNNTDRLEIVKYCKFCKKRTTHKETK